MKSGDSDASGEINQDDKSVFWESDAGLKGYLGTDLNLDIQVNNVDKDNFWLPNLESGSHVP